MDEQRKNTERASITPTIAPRAVAATTVAIRSCLRSNISFMAVKSSTNLYFYNEFCNYYLIADTVSRFKKIPSNIYIIDGELKLFACSTSF